MADYTLVEEFDGPFRLEEDEDGFRVLVLLDPTSGIPRHIEDRLSGVSMIVTLQPDVEEHPIAASIPEEYGWQQYTFDHLPLYREVLLRQIEEDNKDPLDATTFVHVHSHTEFSSLDGLGKVEEIVKEVVRQGQGAVAATDHGNCASHPELQAVCDKYGILPIHGCEAYMVPDRHRRSRSWHEYDGVEVELANLTEAERKKAERRSDTDEVKQEYTHLTLWAMDQVGLRNLWAMSTEAYREGLYDGKPRLDWDTLTRHAEGILVGTGCIRGPVSRPLLTCDCGHQSQDHDLSACTKCSCLFYSNSAGKEEARQNLMRLHGIFGDRLYIEIHCNTMDDQKTVNTALEEFSRQYQIPPVAAVDSHYAHVEHKEVHQIWVAMQTGKTLVEDTTMFQGNQDYHLKTEDEVRKDLAYLPDHFVEEAVANTVELARRCSARVGGAVTTPTYSRPSPEHPDPVKRDEERLIEICLDNWQRKVVGKPKSEEEYAARLEREVRLLIKKQFCGYFMVVWDYVSWAKSQGCLVGPGRGSGGASLAAYLMGIVEIDPVDSDLPFERFITEGRMSLPDFDCVAGETAFVRDGPGDLTVAGLYCRLYGRPDAVPGECQNCGKGMDQPKRGYKGGSSSWICPSCYKVRWALRRRMPSILGRNHLGRLSNQPVIDVLYKGVRETVHLTVSDGRFIESTPEHRHLTVSGWKTTEDICVGDLMVLIDDHQTRPHYTDNMNQKDKDRLFQRAGFRCERCGKDAPRDESWLGKFEIAHLDYSTSDISNLLFLCTPCHRAMDAEIGTPTMIRPVVSKRDSGEQPVYDLVMGHEDHSWVGNGFVTHNCDFPASWRVRLVNYIRDRWGEDYVANIGTVTRLRSKGAINDTVRVMDPILDVPIPFKTLEILKALLDAADAPLAGKHLPWDEFCAQYPDLVDPMIEQWPEVFAVVEVIMDRVKTYGKHAAGVVISTDPALPLTDIPMRLAKDSKTKTEVMVTQFDMHALELLGYVKFDILTLRTLDTLQVAVDLIEQRYGKKVDFHNWDDEYRDPQVWTEVSDGHTLGLFQVETASGTRLIRRVQPQSVDDLAAVMTIVRPGPMRSGLTEAYLRRRMGVEPMIYLDSRLEPILSNTFASMIYQEQVMAICSDLAGYDSTEADEVRSLLGKKKVEKVQAAGEEFVRRAVEQGTDLTVAKTLWEQMSEFARYGFNRAHAYGYAVLGYYCAWLRFHYPVEFLVAALSTVDVDRIPEFIEDCRRCGYEIIPPDINQSQVGFTSEGIKVIYGISLVKGIGGPTAEQIVSGQPYTSLDDFIERTVKPQGSAVNMGAVKTLVSVGAFDSIVDNRRAVEIQLERESSGAAKKCVHKVDLPNPMHPFNLPCVYDWGQEPDPPMLVRGRGKDKTHVPKEPPKKCTVACRQYCKPGAVTSDEVAPYTHDEIMLRERELLGVWVSGSPFDRVNPDYIDRSDKASQIEAGPINRYMGVSIVQGVKKRKDRNQNDYAFVSFNMQDGVIETVCFASLWSRIVNQITPDALGVAIVDKTSRGYTLADYTAL